MASFMSKIQKVTVIQCYASTNEAEEEDKDEFYNQLQATLDWKTPWEILYLMSDMNTKVWKDNTWRELITGKEGIGNINDNGQLFADFCLHNDLAIRGTTFVYPHKDILKITWVSPEMKTRNQIEHITVARRWRR